jgi:two-component system, NtrC family, sensor kinase
MTPNVAAHWTGEPYGRSVLVVEDDADLSYEMSSILESAGYRVDVCTNGRDALARLQRSPTDAVVLDLRMPVMNGWEFVTAKKADASIAQIPVVAMSGDRSAQATAIGAEVYLPKPFDASQLVTAVGRCLLDADRRKLAQRLDDAERLVLLGTIAAGVGHEINNPLTIALASLDLMDRGLSEVLEKVRAQGQSGKREFGELEPPIDHLQQHSQSCRSSIQRIRIIVRDLHHLSRRPGDERMSVDLGALLESVISMARREIEPRAEIVRACEPDVNVFGNEARLGQVFLNLLINAAQSIPNDRKDGHRILVTCRHEGPFAVVEVRDTGRGMTPTQKERIFEPFFTTKGQLGGTGLGLAICKEIVESHGGFIEVSSELGRGSSFTVRLPAVAPMTNSASGAVPPSP